MSSNKMVECPRCGYVMTPFDVECPRCKRMEQEAERRRQELAADNIRLREQLERDRQAQEPPCRCEEATAGPVEINLIPEQQTAQEAEERRQRVATEGEQQARQGEWGRRLRGILMPGHRRGPASSPEEATVRGIGQVIYFLVLWLGVMFILGVVLLVGCGLMCGLGVLVTQ
jgi:hypothetical protein